MDRQARARQLASEYLAKGKATAWFEQLYREAENDNAGIPWADLQPNPNLIEFWRTHSIPSSGKAALIIGCGLGDDAEQVAQYGFQTTAFDISESAIRACRRRFPDSNVNYATTDLLTPPQQWMEYFDFALESYTLQVLPRHLRSHAIRCIADLVREQGYLLVITRGREEQDAEGQMPWPLIRGELDQFAECGLRVISFEDYVDREIASRPPLQSFLSEGNLKRP